jgi:gas vesicle protein
MDKDDLKDFFFETLDFGRYFRRRKQSQWLLHGGIGLGVGVLAGIGFGLLLAPKSGREVRQNLKLGAQRFGEKARTAALKAKDKASKGERTYGNDIGARVDEYGKEYPR